MWVVDTCIVIDVLDSVSGFARPSALALDDHREEGLIVAPITFVELAPAFNGSVADELDFLAELGIDLDFAGQRDAILAAHQAWYAHICRKRMGAIAKRPIADVLIGAYAQTMGGLITRNEDDFRSLYPTLTIFNPTRSNG
jgi:predicted nucleic acid-binding protein